MSAAQVLIVEDDASTRMLLAAIVHRNRYRAVEACDGRTALALLLQHRYDAVLLDLLLPELSGIELLETVGAHTPHVLPRVVVVTAAMESVWASCREIARVRAVIRKPFNLDELERELRACCEGGS